MIANFFQSLDWHGVEYLLISGQATVLYGAATFSEDIDLWINPTEANRGRLLDVLRDSAARFYKLTPPFTMEHLEQGHGFHFILPAGAADETFLDVMGRPPRVEGFARCLATARRMETEWGTIPTIGLKPLVELKKTQRLEDYPIISRLALAWFDQPECRQTETDFLWALKNIFTLPELAVYFTEQPAAIEIAARQFHPAVGEFGSQWAAAGEAAATTEQAVGELFQARIAELQLADRQYWRATIQRMKCLRQAGGLMPEGRLVSE